LSGGRRRRRVSDGGQASRGVVSVCRRIPAGISFGLLPSVGEVGVRCRHLRGCRAIECGHRLQPSIGEVLIVGDVRGLVGREAL
jgi:hypothetical protein